MKEYFTMKNKAALIYIILVAIIFIHSVRAMQPQATAVQAGVQEEAPMSLGQKIWFTAVTMCLVATGYVCASC